MTENFKLVGFDTFEGEYYALEGNYESGEDARKAANKMFKELEKTQPSNSSGGQAFNGIQDRIFVEGPDGSRCRVLPVFQKRDK
jgi:hypothetical protein